MADGRHFEKKTVKSPSLSKRFIDFHEIWHGDANWPFTWDRQLKFRISQNQDGGGRHFQKGTKMRYHSNGLIDLCEIAHDYAQEAQLSPRDRAMRRVN